MTHPRSKPAAPDGGAGSAGSWPLETEWIRRLAHRLVADPHRADDLAQDAWVALLEGPGTRTVHSPKAWMAGLVRNLAARRTRSDLRRVSRELAVARPDSTSAANEALADLALQREVADAVLELDEPYRTALVLRFHRSLLLRQIAEELGVPLSTAHARVRRGLELLRERLDHGRGGDRASWVLALLPLAEEATHTEAPLTPATLSGALGFGLPAKVAAACLVLLGGVLGTRSFMIERDAVRPAGPGEGPGLGSADPIASRPPRVQISAPARTPLDVTEPRSNYTVVGRIVERGAERSVSARVQVANGPVSVSSPAGGRFELDAVPASTEILVVEHPAYERLEVPLTGATRALDSVDLGLLRLTPRGRARVRVIDEAGLPVRGARGELRTHAPKALSEALERDFHVAEPFGVGETDGDGILTFPLGWGAALWVTAPDGRIACSFLRAGEDVTLTLAGPARVARFLDAESGAPVAERTFPVAITTGSRRTVVLVTTDARGRASLPCGPCALTVRKSEPRLLLSAVRIDGVPAPQFRVSEFEARGTLTASEVDIELRVRNAEHVLRLVDGVTGAPITGRAWMHSLYVSDTGERTGLAASSPSTLDRGRVVLGAWFAEPKAKSSKTLRWLAVAGYEVEIFEAEIDLREGAVVKMRPGPARSLRLQSGDKKAVRPRVSIVTSSGATFAIRPDEVGLVGPIPWTPGEAWTVWIGEEERVLDAPTLAAAPEVTLVCGSGEGRIVVRGAPHGAPPVLALSSSGDWRALEPVANEARLGGLPGGEYIVGTRTWIEACGVTKEEKTGWASMLPPDADLVHLAEGETAVVPWNDAWWSSDPIGGVLTCADLEPSELLVLPVVGSLECFVSVGPATPWIHLDGRGRFELPPHHARPSCYVIARLRDDDAWGLQPSILDVLPVRADGSYAVRTTSFELSTRTERFVTVWAVNNPALLSSPVKVLAGEHFSWRSPGSLRSGALAFGVDHLRITGRGIDEPIDVVLVPGTHNVVEVELPPEPAEPVRATVPTLK